MSPIPSAVAHVSDEQLSQLADSPEFVLPIYALVLLPFALYVYHDIVDKRWRQVHLILSYLIAYLLLYTLIATTLVAYIVIEWRYAMDYKEVGAAFLTLIVGSHRLWTLIRLINILRAHYALVHLLQVCNLRLAELAVEMGAFRDIVYFLWRKPRDGVRKRHMAISTSLFDDDYPGDSARIKWLSPSATVHPDDVNECAVRIAIWMRVVLRTTDMSIWHVLTRSRFLAHPDAQTTLYTKLLDTILLRKTPPVAPDGVCTNPGELLINLDFTEEHQSLSEIGVGLCWVAARMRAEEIGQVVAEMPARWMNDTQQSGKELMLETGFCLILAEMPVPHGAIGKLFVTMRDGETNDTSDGEHVWQLIDEIFADAVVALMRVDWTLIDASSDEEDQPSSFSDDEIRKMINTVKDGLSSLRSGLKAFKAEKGYLRHRLSHMIMRAHYGGHLVESVLGEHVLHIPVGESRNDIYALYQAELVLALQQLVEVVGWCEESLAENEDSNGETNDVVWTMCSIHDRGECPAGAFRKFVSGASEAASAVFRAFEHSPKPIKFVDNHTRRCWIG